MVFFASRRGRTSGCLLLTDHPEHKQWELVYVGLSAEFRGRGWGVEAVRRAQSLAGTRPACHGCLLLAVDAANEPAIAMYGEAGFTAWDRRSVLVRLLKDWAKLSRLGPEVARESVRICAGSQRVFRPLPTGRRASMRDFCDGARAGNRACHFRASGSVLLVDSPVAARRLTQSKQFFHAALTRRRIFFALSPSSELGPLLCRRILTIAARRSAPAAARRRGADGLTLTLAAVQSASRATHSRPASGQRASCRNSERSVWSADRATVLNRRSGKHEFAPTTAVQST